MSHLLSPVTTSLDHSARYVCPVSNRMPVNPYVCFRVALAVEGWNCSRDYGSQGHVNPGISQQTVAHVACCAQACSQLIWGGSQSVVDVFHELTWLLCNICVCQVSIVSTRFLPKTGVLVQLLQVFVESCISVKMSSTLKTNKDLDPIYVFEYWYLL